MKKTILHFIFNLGRGGAEMMMVKVIRELTEYNNIVVTLFPENHFGEELICDKYYCLNLSSLLLFPKAALRLKKIILENNVDLVHSHLFWPTIIARLGTPRKIPLITTIHAFIANSVEYKNLHIRILDKLTYRLRNNIIIAVAKGAKEEYFECLRLKPRDSYALHTFVDVRLFNSNDSNLIVDSPGVFKIITVGALRIQKNHKYLVEALSLLKDENIELDVYGSGPLRDTIQKQISDSSSKVCLKGEVKNIPHIIEQYDLFVMSSTYEGFSLGVLEAMAMKVPLLLSDIRSFREQCEDTACYFDLSKVADFADKIRMLIADHKLRFQMAEQAKLRVLDNFTLDQHMKGLRAIYCESF